MSALPETRLITKVAVLYHEQKLTQTDIAKRLGISQVTVSRLLKRAEENQIVRTSVISPPGAFVELEDILEKKFGLTQAIVGESPGNNDESFQAAIGAAASTLMTTLAQVMSLGCPRQASLWRWLIRCIRCGRSRDAKWFKCWEVSAIPLLRPTRTTW
jgi:DNA-binding transcriptional regulator LsrR (DeoR family)